MYVINSKIMINYFDDFEMILVSTSILLPSFTFFITQIENQNLFLKIVRITSCQYTYWNNYLVIVNHFYDNDCLSIFLTINCTTVVIIYNIFHLNCYNLIKQIPNIPDNTTDLQIHFGNFVVHIIPFLMYVQNFYNSTLCVNYNMGYVIILFNMIWALQCFVSFDPRDVYFQIEKKNVYRLWMFLIVLNLSIGSIFCCKYKQYLINDKITTIK
jgi:hypothetical protein